jgi:hypothetical protein
MTSEVAAVRDTEADTHWRDWLAQGAERNRRRLTTLERWAVLIAAGLALWVLLRFV